MISTGRKILAVIFFTLSLAPLALGQQDPGISSKNTPAPSRKEPDYVEEKGFKGRVFEAKHRDPASLVGAINLLGSGFKGASIQYNSDFNTITVRDFPENIAAMEEALKRLDTPQPQRPEIEFRIHVLIASNTPLQSGDYPPELSDVVKQMQSTLNYKHYGLMTSSIHRTKEGPMGLSNKGVAENNLFKLPTPNGNPIFYNYNLGQIALDTAASATAVQIGQFGFEMRVPLLVSANDIRYESVGFRGPVNVRENEKVVVGTTAMGDKGLVVILTAKVIK